MTDLILPDIDLADRLFQQLDRATRQGPGIVRDTYGPGEQAAHDIVGVAAEALELEVKTDAALNLYMTLPGRDRTAPATIVGSHLDSVLQGGNFDGAAGVLAGLATVAGFRAAGFTPASDLTVMAVRAEESAWFDGGYLGSSAAFGKLSEADLALPRSDNGRSLADHMADCGCDLEALRQGKAALVPERIKAYLEVHIEQAPVLVERELPLAVVTGIRGCLRHRDARCVGTYGHSGALPRQYRHDAVAATADLLHGLNREWHRIEAEGKDLVFTVGELMTDPANHGPSKVAGETRFVLDFRSLDDVVMTHMSGFAAGLAWDVGREHGVTFELGETSYTPPALCDANIRGRLSDHARSLAFPDFEMASGAGHDAAAFASHGVPVGMIFIRNENSSHNPDEAMEMDDFAAATRLLSVYLQRDLG